VLIRNGSQDRYWKNGHSKHEAARKRGRRGPALAKYGHFFFNKPMGALRRRADLRARGLRHERFRNPAKTPGDLKTSAQAWGSPTMSPNSPTRKKYGGREVVEIFFG